jgi:hypothetical protein
MHAIDILERLIQGGSQTHRSICHNPGDAVVARASDCATWNDQPVAVEVDVSQTLNCRE